MSAGLGSKHKQLSAQGQIGTSMVEPISPNDDSRKLFPPALAIWSAGFSDNSVNAFCGAVAGAASGVVTCPLDVIKTKLQAQGAFKPRSQIPVGEIRPAYRGMLPTATLIWQQDGVRGMYRGLGPMLLGYLPTWAVYMGVYGHAKDYFYGQTDTKWVAHMAASVTAGASSTLATNPIWVIKTRLMSQVGAAASKDTRTPWHYRNTLDAARQMYASEGMRAFYSGLAPALLGLSHVAIQFPLYEYFKKRFTGLEMGDSSSHESHWFGILSATFVSKVCATTATYPHEVIRTRLQTQQRHPASAHAGNGPLRSPGTNGTAKTGLGSVVNAVKSGINTVSPRYEGVISTCKTIMREEGWRAFYYGMGTNLFRAVPSAMTTMLTFESLKRGVQVMQEEGRLRDEQ